MSYEAKGYELLGRYTMLLSLAKEDEDKMGRAVDELEPDDAKALLAMLIGISARAELSGAVEVDQEKLRAAMRA